MSNFLKIIEWSADLAHVPPDRCGDASQGFSLGIADAAGRGRFAEGNTVAIDGTTLEAKAALRSIVRRDTGEAYEEFLKGLAKESGIETPTREQPARLDRKRHKPAR